MKVPAHLGKIGKEFYRWMWNLLKERKFLDSADVKLIEMAAGAYEDWRNARADVEANGYMITCAGPNGSVEKNNPAVKVAEDAWKRLRSLVPEYGLSPAARAKLAGGSGKKESEDAFESFLGDN